MIVATDGAYTVVIQPPVTSHPLEISYELLNTRGNLVSVQFILSALIYQALPTPDLIGIPSRPDPLDSIVPDGCLADPKTPSLTDAEVYEAYKRHADFDLYTLTQDRAKALQFFRWKSHKIGNDDLVFAKAGHIVIGSCSSVFPVYPPLLHPLAPDTPPKATTDHFEAVKRSSQPYTKLNMLQSSSSFSLRIDTDLTTRDQPGLCRAYRCSLLSIDNQSLSDSIGPLCLKLYDDRFFPMEQPDEEEDDITFWWEGWTTAETQLRCEVSTYANLHTFQGSLLPRCFGAYLVRGSVLRYPFFLLIYLQFTLPDGHQVYGLLMELVESEPLNTGIAKRLSTEQQIAFVGSISAYYSD